MKLGTLFIVNAVVALVFGIAFVLLPGTLAGIYGVTPGPAVNLLGQFFGATLIAIGLLCWLVRNVSEGPAVKGAILALLVGDVIGLIVSLMGTLAGTMNAVGWSSVIIYLLLSLGLAYFQFMKPVRG